MRLRRGFFFSTATILLAISPLSAHTHGDALGAIPETGGSSCRGNAPLVTRCSTGSQVAVPDFWFKWEGEYTGTVEGRLVPEEGPVASAVGTVARQRMTPTIPVFMEEAIARCDVVKGESWGCEYDGELWQVLRPAGRYDLQCASYELGLPGVDGGSGRWSCGFLLAT